MKTQLLIPAAGQGQRLGCNGPKALVSLAGKALLLHTLERFFAMDLLREAVIIVPPESEDLFRGVVESAYPDMGLGCAAGGAERQESVARGLAMLDPATDIVIIHDAARPFVAVESVRESITAAEACGAATVALPVTDTILQGDAGGYLESTPPRERMWACQTPQTFRVEVIRAAHAAAVAEGYLGTDDASLVRRNAGKVKLVKGNPMNFKITTPADLAIAERLFEDGLL